MAKSTATDKEKSIVEFQKEYERLLKKYNIGILDPIVGIDLIAFLSGFSERQINRFIKEDKNFPAIYEFSYKKKGCKLSEVQQWIESRRKTASKFNPLKPLPNLERVSNL
ncbi:helix-turn-helix transcriptional regulator [Commensalibacter oyaizuii]|uniref:AlpA family phage regulatory protein n=1 Tax=Commensalibacter oyaizuii TaxID=3043873 RepID=A0ABT6Q3A8_9PROT|nr:hypothetical protein [Commensalibacter sp. TBRC 16381]MDI2091590.1 hypothetical protein [Commensalibacter sp. TBRC 16381]